MRRSIPLLLLTALFAAPIVTGWLLLFNPQWLPDGRSNHGELLDPVLPVGDTVLATTAGEPFPFATMAGQWTLLLQVEACGEQCHEWLWGLRQIRRAVGVERHRVERLLLLAEPPPPELAAQLDDHFAGTHVALGTGEPGALFRQRLAVHPEAPPEALYLLDPMGNLVLRYPLDAPPEHLLADLEHLLKLSDTWRNHGDH